MENTIRKTRGNVRLSFQSDGHSGFMELPHKAKWESIIKYLKKRGFSVKENPSYKEHYNCLSKYHKIGFKRDVAILMEINTNSIEVKFGNIKNLWTGIAKSFWDNPKDDRYTKLSYLEQKAVELEAYKLIQFCGKYNLTFIDSDLKLNPQEYIIDKLKTNKHIHGNVECLNDIKNSIKTDSYDYRHNSNDKNGNKIICGDRKYFYDYYNKRLSCGIAWHNINNMWWVIFGNEIRNIVSYELFDFDSSLPKRKPVEISRINNILKNLEAKKDYQRCDKIYKYYLNSGLLKAT